MSLTEIIEKHGEMFRANTLVPHKTVTVDSELNSDRAFHLTCLIANVRALKHFQNGTCVFSLNIL